MQTITFYSYKGGTLALANAARYLARLEFRVAALDFDLEAPGLHYKFSTSAEGKAIAVRAGIIDYIHDFATEGKACRSLSDLTIEIEVPGAGKPCLDLIPAGQVPSIEYWLKLAGINWHQLFYSPEAPGVRIFLELKNRILDELQPDFLLIDSRTGISEMGGVATTLLADKVICLVLPTLENLEGARAVLRSLKRSNREIGAHGPEVIVALSRFPQSKDQAVERAHTEHILSILNEEAPDLRDTLSCAEVFVLHSEPALQVREALRVGGPVSPDDSILLRDYLRLFAKVVPRELVGPKVGKLIERARDKIWDDPEGAMKEVEELAESFGHPDYYRAVLRFYDVRNVTGIAALKRAQRLWELTGDSEDPLLWQMLKKNYTVNPRFPGAEWLPSADFVESVWRGAGAKDPEFAQLLAQTYSVENEDSRAADILLETMKAYEPTAPLASNCILYLNYARREDEAEGLVLRFIPAFGNDPQFVDAWARLAAAARNDRAVLAMINHPAMNIVRERHPAIGAQLLMLTGMDKEASALADLALRRAGTGRGEINTSELGEVFSQLGRWPEFEEAMRGKISQRNLDELRKRLSVRRPARRILNAHGEES